MNSLRYLGKDWSSGSMLTPLRVGLILRILPDTNTSEIVLDDTQSPTQSVELSEIETPITQSQRNDQVVKNREEQFENSSVSSHTTYRSSNSNPTNPILPPTSISSNVQLQDGTNMSVDTSRPVSKSVASTASSDVGSVHTAVEEQVVEKDTTATRVKKDESNHTATTASKQMPTSISKQSPHNLTAVYSHDPVSLIIDDPVLADFYRKKQMKIEAEETAKRKALQPQQARVVPKVIYKQTRTPTASVKSAVPSVQDNQPKKSTGIVETMIDGKIWHMRPDLVKEPTPMPASTFLEVSPKIAPHRRKILPIKKPVTQKDFIGKLHEEHGNMMSGKKPEKSEFVWQTDLEVLHNIERASKIKSWNESMAEVRKQFSPVDSGPSPLKPEKTAQIEVPELPHPPRFNWASQDQVPEVSSSSTPQQDQMSEVSPSPRFQLSANAQVFTPSAARHQTKPDEHDFAVFSTPQTLVPASNFEEVRSQEHEDYDSPASIWAGLDKF